MFAKQLRAAFSLVELLVVIGILAILMGLLLGAIQVVRQSAARARCANQIRQVGLALQTYCTRHGHLPPDPARDYPSHDPNAMLSWMALILPEMEHDALWTQSVEACRINLRPFENPPHVGYATVIPTYVCPNDGRLDLPLTNNFGVAAAYTDYIGVSGTGAGGNGVFGPIPGLKLTDIVDGASNTIAVGERPPPNSLQAGRWYTAIWNSRWGSSPGPDEAMAVNGIGFPDEGCPMGVPFSAGRLDNPCDRTHFWSLHPGGAHFAFSDGSVRFLAYSAAPIMPALATRAGGEAVSVPD
jgi:prepilin-type N-terminal cleavage/methylation domain-containing protein/prepilin-type processing-associated H-X9-DG protein